MSIQLPKTVRVGCYDFTVIELTDEMREHGIPGSDGDTTHSLGRTTQASMEIYIYLGYGPVTAANTLLHEIMHGIIMSAGAHHAESMNEEFVVEMMANGMMQVIRDNPDLLSWLNENGTPQRSIKREQALRFVSDVVKDDIGVFQNAQVKAMAKQREHEMEYRRKNPGGW